MKRLSIISLTLVLILSLFSCEPKEEPVIKVSRIILNSETLSMTEGDTFKLTATVDPQNATNKMVAWSSSNASIANVEDGMVTAVKEGTATITAASRDGGAKASCTVTVSAKTIAVQSVTLDQTKVEMTVGESLALTATVKPDDATDKTITWKSSDAGIASVDQSGKITAIGEGSATITAKAGDKEATCSVIVKKPVVPVESVTLDQESVTLEEGQTITLTATVKPDNATDKTVTWESSDTDVATVNNGVVTAVSAGTATIKAKAGDKEALCVVTVSVPFIPVESVTLNYTSLPMGKGQTFTLTATAKPDNATDKTVTWESSDTAVATVDQNGTVKSIGGGSATITAKAGDKTATCLVTVTVPVESITLDFTNVTIKEGQTFILTATIKPDDATDTTVFWGSTNSDVATVSDGIVSAIRAGSATITAHAGNLSASCIVDVEISSARKFLTFSSEGTTTISFTSGNNNLALYYSTDKTNWKRWDTQHLSLTFYDSSPIYVCGDNPTGNLGTFRASGSNFSVTGDIMSLINKEETIDTIPTAGNLCFAYLFKDCTNLTVAPELSATTLAPYCYYEMFKGCENLKVAPKLPATSLASHCYEEMFYDCKSLLQAPELPARVMAESCYQGMFKGCIKITSAPALPATELADGCYVNMFALCSSLRMPPTLPATTLAKYCYASMFGGCTNLSVAPQLPALTLADYCYSGMFSGCRALTKAPALPALTLADYCYSGMFQWCENLAKAPELPATQLKEYCYSFMFNGCENLSKAPELPATQLKEYCYEHMFNSCKSLSKAPRLHVSILVDHCYEGMFMYCANLNNVECLATSIGTDSVNGWLEGVSSSGTFKKAAAMHSWASGPSGIPEGWTVVDVQ